MKIFWKGRSIDCPAYAISNVPPLAPRSSKGLPPWLILFADGKTSWHSFRVCYNGKCWTENLLASFSHSYMQEILSLTTKNPYGTPKQIPNPHPPPSPTPPPLPPPPHPHPIPPPPLPISTPPP